jgi:hypothetical protein
MSGTHKSPPQTTKPQPHRIEINKMQKKIDRKQQYRPAPPTITGGDIKEAEYWLDRLAPNLGHGAAAYLAFMRSYADAARKSSKQSRARARDERIRWVAREYFGGKSVNRVAAELLTIAGRLRADSLPREEPAYSVFKIIELNDGKMPSDKTIRNALQY